MFLLDQNILAVINVGVVFFLSFTGFRTLENIEKILLEFTSEEDSSFTADGFISLGIVFLVYAVSVCTVPSVIVVLGLKGTLIASTVTYIIFLTSFLTFSTSYVYVTSALVGVGLALTWGSGGNIVNVCSDEMTIIRNFGIFYLMYSASLVGGNAFEYFQSQNLTRLDYQVRMTLILVLIGVSCVGTLAACVLRFPKGLAEERIKGGADPIKAFFNTLDMMRRRETQLMCVSYFYAGLFVSFASGVYSSSVGSTLKFASSKSLIGLSGVFIGVGGVIGCAFLSTFGIALSKWNRLHRILACFAIHAVPLLLTLLNLPNNSPQGDTNEDAIIPSSATLAIAVSCALGLGMTLINNQCYDIIEFMFEDNHTGANAIFNFFLSIGSSSSFFYSSYVGLYFQLGILLGLLVASTLCVIVAINNYKNTMSIQVDRFTVYVPRAHLLRTHQYSDEHDQFSIARPECVGL